MVQHVGPPGEADDGSSGLVDRSYRGKRAFDLLALFILGPPALIVGFVCSVAVAATSQGPVLFRQTRVGHLGRDFVIVKFRTMIDNPEGNALVPDDAQVTAVGRLLRRTSLDEIPQLFNVWRGDMSMVGPRPTLRYQVDRYDERQRQRLAVRPGLTGLAQVEGRNTLDWADRIDRDLHYVDHASVGMDLRLVGRTVPAMLGGGGVEGHSTVDPLSMPTAGTSATSPERGEPAVGADEDGA